MKFTQEIKCGATWVTDGNWKEGIKGTFWVWGDLNGY